MTYDPETLRPGDSALAALDMMRLGRYRHLPVVDGETIVGIVSVGDLYEAVRQTLEEQLQSAETLIYGEQYTLGGTLIAGYSPVAFSPGARAVIVSAWIRSRSSGPAAAFTRRCRSSRLRPAKLSATIRTAKWVSPPSRHPA